jgi:hypothetical protein
MLCLIVLLLARIAPVARIVSSCCSSEPCVFLRGGGMEASGAISLSPRCRYFPRVQNRADAPRPQIMRRIMRKIVAGEGDQLGDLSTVAEPGVVDLIKEKVAESA